MSSLCEKCIHAQYKDGWYTCALDGLRRPKLFLYCREYNRRVPSQEQLDYLLYEYLREDKELETMENIEIKSEWYNEDM